MTTNRSYGQEMRYLSSRHGRSFFSLQQAREYDRNNPSLLELQGWKGSLLRDCEKLKGLCFYFIERMEEGCMLVTDSGGNKRYVLGRLDSGEPFAERATYLEV